MKKYNLQSFLKEHTTVNDNNALSFFLIDIHSHGNKENITMLVKDSIKLYSRYILLSNLTEESVKLKSPLPITI